MSLKSVLKKKSLGILVHPSSLPGGSYCGTFGKGAKDWIKKLCKYKICLLYTSPSPRDRQKCRMPSSA